METKLSSGATLTGPVGKPTLDLGKMSARCIFATDSLDRVGDVLNVRGIRHRRPPPEPRRPLRPRQVVGDPIGKSVDPAGNYTVEITDHEAYQTTYFFPTQLGGSTSPWWRWGGAQPNSIGYRPTKKRKNTAGGFFLDAVELVELSWVGVPANADCVRAFLAKDKIEGKSIHPQLRAALEAQLPTKTTVISGGLVMGAIKAHKSLVKAAITAAKKELPPEEVKEETPAPVQEAAAETPAPVEETPAPVEEPAKQPLGAQMLQAAHSAMAAWIEYCGENLPLCENAEVQAELLDLCEGVFERMGTVADLHKQQYPDLEPLPEVEEPDEADAEGEKVEPAEGDEPAEGGEEGKENPADEDEIHAGEGGDKSTTVPGKSYSGGVKRLTKAMGGVIKECADHLTEMKDAENLTSAQKLVCRHYSKELGSMVEEKEQEAPAEDKGDADDIEKDYEALSDEDKKAFDAAAEEWLAQQEAEDLRVKNLEAHNQRLSAAAARRNRR